MGSYEQRLVATPLDDWKVGDPPERWPHEFVGGGRMDNLRCGVKIAPRLRCHRFADHPIHRKKNAGEMRRNMLKIVGVVGSIFSMALCAGCGPSSASPSHSLTGSIVVNNYMGSAQIVGGECTGKQGYDDIREGASVVVKDESGKILATSALGKGTAPDHFSCHFAFTVNDLPDAKFYQIEVSHRGEVTFSKSDLDNKYWSIQLNLG